MKDIIIWLLCLVFAGLILEKIGSIVLYFKIEKHKKFLKSACPFGDNRIACDYSHFHYHFHAFIKILKGNKNYNVISLFGQYLLAIKVTLEFKFYKNTRGIELTDDLESVEQLLVQLGYSDTEWCMVCEAMDKDNEDEMILKQLYWWPSFCLEFTGEKFLANSMKHLHVSDDNAVMNRIMIFANDLRIFKNVQNHLGNSKALKSNVLVMEKAFVKFLKDALQNPYLTFGDLQKIKDEVFTSSFTNDPYELSDEKSFILVNITSRIYALKEKFQNTSSLV